LPSPPPLAFANPDNLTVVLRHLLENPEAVRRYGEAGRKYALEHHDAMIIAERLIDIYRRPLRPIDPVAVADFLSYQGRKHLKKTGEIAKGEPSMRGEKNCEALFISSEKKNHFKDFLWVTKNKGLGTAFTKTLGYLKGRLFG
jgi:hypothetical protein